ncbi:MAG: putative glycoside hydrolase [Gemmatimonadetes bacterium]|nr:putative glycoside hydrolase [Gemmatimonadota bacterium]
MIRLRGLILPLATLALLGSCKAGPSAFDKPATAMGPADTADASSLPELPAVVGPDPADTGSNSGVTGSGSGALSPDSAGLRPTASEPAPVHSTVPPSAEVPHFERPEHIRGIYLNAWTAGSARRVQDLLALAGRTEINTFVIDIKDATGYVSHQSAVPMANEIGATDQIRIRDLPGLLRRLYDEGIYPIARIVIVRDSVLTAARPDLAVHDTTGEVFTDAKGFTWVNPYSHEVWDYEVALAREVARMGFPEIQWDYIRFPDIPAAKRSLLVYPGADHRTKAQVIGEFLSYSREQLADLGTQVTADVFGVTTSILRDVGIGQVWESIVGSVDVVLPMVYPSHYWKGSFGYDQPNAYPYEIIRQALGDALRRSAQVPGAGSVRPWLQDFSLGKPAYGAAEVRAEIQATFDSGIREWILWNPGSHYTEGALEPHSGFATEPRIRVATEVVPVSRRWELVDSADGQDIAMPGDSTSAPRDSLKVRLDTGEALPDTTMTPMGVPTPGADTLSADTTRIPPDTASAPDTMTARRLPALNPRTRASRSREGAASSRGHRRIR